MQKRIWKSKKKRRNKSRLFPFENKINISTRVRRDLLANQDSSASATPDTIIVSFCDTIVKEKWQNLEWATVNRLHNYVNSDKENKFDVASNAFTIKSGLTDALDIQNKSGLYSTGPETINLPYGGAYGYVSVSKNTDNLWVFIKFFPTSLDDIYYNFYSGYGEPSWYGWVKQELKPVI